MTADTNPLQKKLKDALNTLISDARTWTNTADIAWIHEKDKEKFHESFRKSWEYMYIPLGAMFPVTSSVSDATHDMSGIPPGADAALGRHRAPLQMDFSTTGEVKFVRDSQDEIDNFFDLERTYVPGAEYWKLFFLSELLSELVWLAKTAKTGREIHLKAFRQNSDITQIGFDVLSIWTFELKKPELQTCQKLINFYDYVENTGLRWSISSHENSEFGEARFIKNSSEKEGKKLESVMRFRNFYDDHNCCGVLLFQHKDKAIFWNGDPIESVQSAFADACLRPLATVMADKLFDGYDYSAYVIFGASPELEGVYGQTIPKDEAIGISASGTFIHLGLYCSFEEAKAISKSVHAGIRNLQAELFAHMAKVRMDQITLDRAQLKTQADVLKTVRPRIEKINKAIATLQSDAQFINLHLSRGQEGLFAAYSEVETLFEHGREIRIPGRVASVTVDHLCSYVKNNRPADVTWILSWAICYFIGEPPNSFFRKPVTRIAVSHSEQDEDKALEHLSVSMTMLLERAAADSRLSIALVQLLHSKNSRCPEATNELKLTLIRSNRNLRTEMLLRIKTRYHSVLKTRESDVLKIMQLAPFVNLEHNKRLDFQVWTNHGFASHAPILRFLDYFLAFKDGADNRSYHYYRLVDEVEPTEGFKSVAFMLMKTSKSDPSHTAKPTSLFDQELNAYELATLLARLHEDYNNPDGEVEQIGYGIGDISTPFFQLMRATLVGAEPVANAQDSEHLVLKFAEKFRLSIIKTGAEQYANTICFQTKN